MFEKIKKISLSIASIGPLGNYRWGFLPASLLGIPVVYVFYVLHKTLPSVAYFLCISLVMSLIFVIHFAHLSLAEEYPANAFKTILINDTVGVFIALTGSPLTHKFIFVGTALYHLLRYCIPILLEKHSVNLQASYIPNVVSILATSVIAGMSVNWFFLLVTWLVK
jgi:hypothetical protein